MVVNFTHPQSLMIIPNLLSWVPEVPPNSITLGPKLRVVASLSTVISQKGQNAKLWPKTATEQPNGHGQRIQRCVGAYWVLGSGPSYENFWYKYVSNIKSSFGSVCRKLQAELCWISGELSVEELDTLNRSLIGLQILYYIHYITLRYSNVQ